MKTEKELDALKEEIAALNKKLAALSDEELKQVVGGGLRPGEMPPGTKSMFTCPFCDRFFTNVLSLADHVDAAHGGKLPPKPEIQ